MIKASVVVDIKTPLDRHRFLLVIKIMGLVHVCTQPVSPTDPFYCQGSSKSQATGKQSDYYNFLVQASRKIIIDTTCTCHQDFEQKEVPS